MSGKIEHLDHLVLTVADIAATCRFYEDVLGMQARVFEPSPGDQRWALHFGRHKINLHVAGREFEPKALHPTPGSADLCFLVSGTIDDWQSHLHAQGTTIEDGPVPRTGATGPIISLYLRDPDGNLIELSVPDQR